MLYDFEDCDERRKAKTLKQLMETLVFWRNLHSSDPCVHQIKAEKGDITKNTVR